jgi:hypothetical protein
MLLREGKKLLRYGNTISRKFCLKDKGLRTSYKPLIIYSTGIALVGGLLGHGYTKWKLSKIKTEEVNGQQQADPKEPIATPVEAEKKEQAVPAEEPAKIADPNEGMGPLFKQVFLAADDSLNIRRLTAEEQANVSMLKDDYVIFIVPPKEDEELLKLLHGHMSNLRDLYNHANEKKLEKTVLQFGYVPISNRESLEKLGRDNKFEINLDKDVPVFMIKNQMRKGINVVNIKDMLKEEEKFYLQFRPLKMVASHNQKNFRKILEDLETDEVILMQYCPKGEAGCEDVMKEFYANTVDGTFSKLKTVDTVFAQDIGWYETTQSSPEKDAQYKVSIGDWFIVQKKTSESLASAKEVKLEGLNGEYLIYPVLSSPPGTKTSEDQVLSQAAEEFYKRNVAVHRELIPADPEYSLHFMFNKNSLTDTSYAGIVKVLRETRESLASSDIGDDKLKIYMIPKSFNPSQGRNIFIQLRENKKSEQRFKYRMENKSAETAKEMAKNMSYVTSNDLFEYGYPEDLGFSSSHMVQFISKGITGRLREDGTSQTVPAYERYSRKITGTQFSEQIKKNGIGQALFIYSKSCASCKRFTPLYEKLARENIASSLKGTGHPCIFNRMSSDKNEIPNDRNYDSTPVFMVYRGDHKDRPFLYKSNLR